MDESSEHRIQVSHDTLKPPPFRRVKYYCIGSEKLRSAGRAPESSNSPPPVQNSMLCPPYCQVNLGETPRVAHGLTLEAHIGACATSGKLPIKKAKKLHVARSSL
jgi:hypothetical protein